MKTNLLALSLLWCCATLWATPISNDSITKGKLHSDTGTIPTKTDIPRDSLAPKQNNVDPLLARWERQKSTEEQPKTKFRSFPELESTTMDMHYGLLDGVAEFSPEYVAQQFGSSSYLGKSMR